MEFLAYVRNRTSYDRTWLCILQPHPKAGTKQSINTPLIFPVYAFADPAFTDSVPEAVTIDTAIPTSDF